MTPENSNYEEIRALRKEVDRLSHHNQVLREAMEKMNSAAADCVVFCDEDEPTLPNFRAVLAESFLALSLVPDTKEWVRREPLEKILAGQFNNDCGRDPIMDACEQAMLVAQALPEEYDTEDFSLGCAVASIVTNLAEAESENEALHGKLTAAILAQGMERRELIEKLAEAEKERDELLEAGAFDPSPAMVQARNDHLNAELATLESIRAEHEKLKQERDAAIALVEMTRRANGLLSQGHDALLAENAALKLAAVEYAKAAEAAALNLACLEGVLSRLRQTVPVTVMGAEHREEQARIIRGRRKESV